MNKTKLLSVIAAIICLTGCKNEKATCETVISPIDTITKTRIIDFMSEHKELSNFLYKNIDNTNMNEEAISLYECGYLKSYADKELSEIYYCEEIFDDFNGDGKEEMLVIRDLTSDAPHMLYYDIWYTDGKTCKCIFDNVANSFKYTYVDNILVFCNFDTIVGGSSKQYPQCFIFNGNELKEITAAEGEIVYDIIDENYFGLRIEKNDNYYNIKLDGTTLVIAE